MWIQHVNKKTVGALLLAGTLLSAPTRRVDIDHIGAFSFKVEIEGVTAGEYVSMGSFKSVEGLDSEVEVVEFQDGDDLILRKRPGRTKYSNITLKKGSIATTTLYKWRQDIVAKKVSKKNGRITLMDDSGQEILRYNFFEAWPSKWKGYTLDGKGADVNVEEMELAVEKLERE